MKRSTKTIEVMIFPSVPHRIEGKVHLPKGARLTDMLGESSQRTDFVPVTDCKIYNREGKLVYSTDFLVLNRRHIVMIFEKAGGRD